jgi:hypothetical protein
MQRLIVPVLVLSWVSVSATAASNAQQTPGTESRPAAKPPGHAVNPVGEATAAFKNRLDDYLKLRSAITAKIPDVSETHDPNKISAREKALGEAIIAARMAAKPGDLFGSMTPIITKIIAKDWATRSAADRKAIFKELPKGVQVTINRPYPTTLPLLTVPSNLLVNLPTLPDDLEYRSADRHLLLRDRDANLVLDILYNVLPPVAQSRVEK